MKVNNQCDGSFRVGVCVSLAGYGFEPVVLQLFSCTMTRGCKGYQNAASPSPSPFTPWELRNGVSWFWKLTRMLFFFIWCYLKIKLDRSLTNRNCTEKLKNSNSRPGSSEAQVLPGPAGLTENWKIRIPDQVQVKPRSFPGRMALPLPRVHQSPTGLFGQRMPSDPLFSRCQPPDVTGELPLLKSLDHEQIKDLARLNGSASASQVFCTLQSPCSESRGAVLVAVATITSC